MKRLLLLIVGGKMLAKAKRDICVLMEDGHFSDFKEGAEYRFIFRNDNQVVLMDENKLGYICDRSEFDEDFEISRI